MPKLRLDQLLIEKGLFATRSQARAAIMAGEVIVNDQRVDKCGTLVAVDADITVRRKATICVSRGGDKLQGALSQFDVEVRDKTAIDIGASTGGFSDCLLKNGCQLVYAVDVSYGILDAVLRRDHRIIPIERTNARNLTWESFVELASKAIRNEIKQGKPLGSLVPDKVDLVVMDVSFISILKILPALKTLLKPGGQVISLVKPQFEAKREQVGQGGIVTDPAVHQEVLEKNYQGNTRTGLHFAGPMRFAYYRR